MRFYRHPRNYKTVRQVIHDYPIKLRKSRLSRDKQKKRIDAFMQGISARSAAKIAQVNRNIAIYYYQRLRIVILSNKIEEVLLICGGMEITNKTKNWIALQPHNINFQSVVNQLYKND